MKEEIANLVEESYRMIAPKRLCALLRGWLSSYVHTRIYKYSCLLDIKRAMLALVQL